LTLRKFFLLLAEYYDQQWVEDNRLFQLIRIHFKEAPPPGAFFPLLGDGGARVPAPVLNDDDPDIDDQIAFQAVAASIPNLRH
jgi:hypothetical protein